MEETNKEISKQEANQILVKERQARIEDCKLAIEKILAEKNCRIDVSVVLRQNQITPQISIISND